MFGHYHQHTGESFFEQPASGATYSPLLRVTTKERSLESGCKCRWLSNLKQHMGKNFFTPRHQGVLSDIGNTLPLK